MTPIDNLVTEWRAMGPVAWSEGPYGWIDIDGQPITLLSWQRAVLLAWWERREEVSTLAISNIKKTGKTLTNALLLAWRWLTLPGEHFAVGNDLDQSTGRQFAEIAAMVKRNPFLKKNVKVTAKQLTFLPTGSTVTALASDAVGNAGANHLTSSHTEAWGIEYEASVRAFEELTPPPGLFYGFPTLRICDSYSGFEGESATWHGLVDRGLDHGQPLPGEWPLYQAGGLLLFHIEGEEAQRGCFRGTPEQAAAYYSEQKRSLRANTFTRLHLNRRTPAVGNFCTSEEWATLFDPAHEPLPPGSPMPVFVGMDLAVAANGDNAVICGVYPGEDGRAKLAFHKIWRGSERATPLKLGESVLPYLIQQAKSYKLHTVFFDPWQAAFLSDELKKHKIHAVPVQQTHASRAPRDTALQQMVMDKSLVLYNHPDLQDAHAGASAVELPNGLIFLKKAGRLKIDTLVALSLCASSALHASRRPQKKAKTHRRRWRLKRDPRVREN